MTCKEFSVIGLSHWAGVQPLEAHKAVVSLLVVSSVFLSAGNMEVIGVMTWFKTKKSFLGHVVHTTSAKHTCSETLCFVPFNSEQHGSLESFRN